jgi:hypothetical protein
VDRHGQIGAIRFVEQAVVLVLSRHVARAGHRYIPESSPFRENTARSVGL